MEMVIDVKEVFDSEKEAKLWVLNSFDLSQERRRAMDIILKNKQKLGFYCYCEKYSS